MADHEEITIAVAEEPGGNPGNYSTDWNIYDPAGKAAAAGVPGAPAALTFVGWKVIRAQWFDQPTMRLRSRDFTRKTSAPAIPEPSGHANAISGGPTVYGAAPGELMEVYEGDLEIQCQIPSEGSGTATPGGPFDHPFHQVMRTTFGYVTPAASSDTVNGAAANASTYTPTAPDDYRVGQMIAIVRNNAYEFARVSRVDRVTPLIYLETELTGGALADTTKIIHCLTYHELLGTTQPTVCLRVDMEGKRMFAPLCRLRSWRLEEDDQGTLVTMVVGNAGLLRDDSNAATVAALVTDGFDVDRLQACSVLSTDVVRTASAPGQLAASEFCPESVAISVEAKLKYSRCAKRLGGVEQIQVGSTPMTATIARDPITQLERMAWEKNNFALIFGFGPASTTGGSGMGVCMSSAHRTSPNMGISEDENQHQLLTVDLEAGEYDLDVPPDTGAGDPASTATDKPWLIGFPLVAP